MFQKKRWMNLVAACKKGECGDQINYKILVDNYGNASKNAIEFLVSVIIRADISLLEILQNIQSIFWKIFCQV